MKRLNYKAEQTQSQKKKGVDSRLKRILYSRPMSLRKSDFKITKPVAFKLSTSNRRS